MIHRPPGFSSSAAPPAREWQPAHHPPAPYEFALLSFADGATFRGAWNGSIWWGYDPRQRRACALEPVAWLPWDSARFASFRRPAATRRGTKGADRRTMQQR